MTLGGGGERNKKVLADKKKIHLARCAIRKEKASRLMSQRGKKRTPPLICGAVILCKKKKRKVSIETAAEGEGTFFEFLQGKTEKSSTHPTALKEGEKGVSLFTPKRRRNQPFQRKVGKKRFDDKGDERKR